MHALIIIVICIIIIVVVAIINLKFLKIKVCIASQALLRPTVQVTFSSNVCLTRSRIDGCLGRQYIYRYNHLNSEVSSEQGWANYGPPPDSMRPVRSFRNMHATSRK